MFEIKKYINKLNIIVISDLHLCNNLDRIDLVHKTYKYASDNDIKYVVNLGDLIDGVMPHNKNSIKIDTTEKQIEYVIDNYPKYNGIKTLMLYGNHDYYSKYNNDIDVAKEISSSRKDIYNLGYGESYIRIDNNFIKLFHKIDFIKNYKNNIETNISFIGHNHCFKAHINDNSVSINVPSLSNLSPNGNINMPGILDVKYDFFNDCISKINVDFINIENDSIITSIDSSIDFTSKKIEKIRKSFS